MIRAISILLILWGCAFAHPIEITSSTPMGMPCGGLTSGLSTVGCMPDAQCGWMVVLKTGDAAAFAGKLIYIDAEGKEQMAAVTAAATGEYTALAFRVGVFRPGTGNRFVSAEITSLKAAATVRQDAAGAIITVGETAWGPPLRGFYERATGSGATEWRSAVPMRASIVTPRIESGDQLLHFAERGSRLPILIVRFVDGRVVTEQPPLDMHPAPIASSDIGIIGPAPETLSDLAVSLAGESLRVTPRISGLTTIVTKGDPAQAAINLKEYK